VPQTQTDALEGGDSWMAVIGRCLAYLCLKHADMAGKEKGEQAEFLIKLGLGPADAAAMVGSTEESIRVLMRRRSKKGGKRSGAKKSTKSKEQRR
jgi:hypothetical protein